MTQILRRINTLQALFETYTVYESPPTELHTRSQMSSYSLGRGLELKLTNFALMIRESPLIGCYTRVKIRFWRKRQSDNICLRVNSTS